MVNLISFWSEQARYYKSIMNRSNPSSKQYKEAKKNYDTAERLVNNLTKSW
jgi:hypothetical protein